MLLSWTGGGNAGFLMGFMQRPDAKELLERKKVSLTARGVRLN